MEKLGEFTRSYWPVIAAALLMAVAWGTSTTQLYFQGQGQTAISAKIDKVSDGVGEIKKTLAAVEVKTDDARSEIADLRRRMREVELRR